MVYFFVLHGPVVKTALLDLKKKNLSQISKLSSGVTLTHGSINYSFHKLKRKA